MYAPSQSPPAPDAELGRAPWYAALLAPVEARVAAGWRRIPGGAPDPAAIPRAGLGGAIVIHVARGWGTRRWQEAGRVAVAVVEGANQRVHLGAPDAPTRATWFAADLRVALTSARTVARRDEVLLRRVAARLLGGDRPGETPVPEAVAFVRGAVAAGVIAGAVPDAVHAALDTWAVALGTAMEAVETGSDPLADPLAALAEAAAALVELPDADAKERLLAVLDPGPAPTGATRVVTGWAPYAVPRRPLPDDPITAAMDAALVGEGPLRDAARWLASLGGKRLRAQIALAAARAVGGDPTYALPAAAAVEWVHAASLVLDDIVDEADLRRGAPALHQLTSTPFATGVAAWILAHTALSTPALAEPMLALAEGQRAELARAGDVAMPLDAWYAIAGQKTARLFSAAATLGGRAAGAGTRDQKRLARYGQELGLAFQIVDDVLDLVGDEAALGKRPGQDLRTGRVTYPLLVLRELDPETFRALAGGPDAAGTEGTQSTAATHDTPDHPDTPHALLAALTRHDVPARCLARARAHHDRALAALAGLDGDHAELVALAARCVERRA